MACDDETIGRRIDRIRRGLDPQDNFQQIYTCFFIPLQRFFRRCGVPEEEGRDLAQDTLGRGFDRLSTFRGNSKFKTWLFRIARNLTQNYWRDRSTAKRGAIEVSTTFLAEAGREVADLDLRPEPLGDPHRDTERRERTRLVRRAVEELPPQMRRCVLLTFDDRTQAEIALLMGIKEGTVKAQMSQARARLRPLLEDLLGRDPGSRQGGEGTKAEEASKTPASSGAGALEGNVSVNDASEGDASESDPVEDRASEDEERREP